MAHIYRLVRLWWKPMLERWDPPPTHCLNSFISWDNGHTEGRYKHGKKHVWQKKNYFFFSCVIKLWVMVTAKQTINAQSAFFIMSSSIKLPRLILNMCSVLQWCLDNVFFDPIPSTCVFRLSLELCFWRVNKLCLYMFIIHSSRSFILGCGWLSIWLYVIYSLFCLGSRISLEYSITLDLEYS